MWFENCPLYLTNVGALPCNVMSEGQNCDSNMQLHVTFSNNSMRKTKTTDDLCLQPCLFVFVWKITQKPVCVGISKKNSNSGQLLWHWSTSNIWE